MYNHNIKKMIVVVILLLEECFLSQILAKTQVDIAFYDTE